MGATKRAKREEAARQAELLKDAAKQPVPELYFATVRAIGTPVDPVSDALEHSLADARFLMSTVKLSEALDAEELIGKAHRADSSPYERYRRLDRAAVELRYGTDMRDAVAVAAIREVHDRVRKEVKRDAARQGLRGTTFLFRNLMHHEEVGRLRKLYDRQFFMISIHSSEEDRKSYLAEILGEGERHGGTSLHPDAQDLIDREAEFFRRSRLYDPETAILRKCVTNIPKTFQYGDLFVDAADPSLDDQIDRFIDLVFDHPFHTPTRDEIGMSDAFSAALQSGNLARQVGAAICSEDGDLLATGTNDVPKPGGGVYRSDDEPDDYRDHNPSPRLSQYRRGFDVSDPTRRGILNDLVRRMLFDPAWLRTLDEVLGDSSHAAAALSVSLESVVEAQLKVGKRGGRKARNRSKPLDLERVIDQLIESPLIWGAQFFDMLEYGRTMHAEMDAITSAARKGVSIRGATLYCTTLPCHECARLIVGAGIRRVIYIEPYEKSRSKTLFDSEIRFTTLARSRQDPLYDGKEYVDFVPYVGISPRRFAELFAKGDRKLQDQEGTQRTLKGERAKWNKADGKVRETIVTENAIRSPRRLADVLDHERLLVDELKDGLASRQRIPDRFKRSGRRDD